MMRDQNKSMCVLLTLFLVMAARCWQQTGLEGNFAQDFVASWEARAKPVASAWAATQEQWLQALIKFEGESFHGTPQSPHVMHVNI